MDKLISGKTEVVFQYHHILDYWGLHDRFSPNWMKNIPTMTFVLRILWSESNRKEFCKWLDTNAYIKDGEVKLDFLISIANNGSRSYALKLICPTWIILEDRYNLNKNFGVFYCEQIQVLDFGEWML